MKASDIDPAVRTCFSTLRWLSQCRVGCGFGEDGERTVDMWGISEKRPYLHVSVEIKVSRNDFFRDLKSPLKQRRARMMANQFYFAAPKGMLAASDLPTWAGLVEVAEGWHTAIVVPAPWFDSSPPTWSFLASLVRRFEKAHLNPTPDLLAMCRETLNATQRGDIHRAHHAYAKAAAMVASLNRNIEQPEAARAEKETA